MSPFLRGLTRCVAAGALCLLLAACGNSAAQPTPQPTPAATTAPAGGASLDQATLIEALRSAGGQITEKGTVQQPFLSAEGSLISLNGADVQIYEYPDGELAAEETRILAKAIADGAGGKTNWGGVPHAFAAGRVVVLYIGDDRDIFGRLQSVLGPSVA